MRRTGPRSRRAQRVHRPLALGGAAAVVVTASFAVGTPAHADGFRAHWAFTDTGSPPPVLTDDSGNGNDGVPEGGVVGDGSAFSFDGTGRVVVPDSPSLNPGTDDFSYSVTFITTLPASGTDYDLLRKGRAATKGGEYKVEIVNAKGHAKALCLVKDDAKHVARIRAGKGTLADGKVHTVTCSKTSTGVTITVDSLAPKKRSTALGAVGNTAELTIGAQAATGGDWFDGSMSDASVQ